MFQEIHREFSKVHGHDVLLLGRRATFDLDERQRRISENFVASVAHQVSERGGGEDEAGKEFRLVFAAKKTKPGSLRPSVENSHPPLGDIGVLVLDNASG